MSTISDPRRTHVHGMWAGVAAHWADHADAVDERSTELTARMLVAAGIGPGQRVLELASGPGGAGLAAAAIVGDGGEVLVSDVAAEMVAIAAERAHARGLANVRTAVLDLEDIDQPDGSFDAVLCREGLMFAVEPERAVAEIVRVLRPGGRLAAAVWGPQGDNPWLGLVFGAVSAEVGITLPPPGMPGPFALGDAHRLHGLLTDAGCVDVAVGPIAVPLRTPSFEDWWARMTAIAGPLASIIAALDATKLANVQAHLRGAVAPYASAGGLELPGVSLLASARRP